MKLKVAWKNIVRYVRTDLKEIALPSSLPDPPSSTPKPRKLTLQEHLQVWRTASKLYVQSWRTGTVDEEELAARKSADKTPEDLSAVEELALAARAGGDKLKPALQRLYMTRAAAYRDALRSFVEGYREGIAEVMASEPFQGLKGTGLGGGGFPKQEARSTAENPASKQPSQQEKPQIPLT